MSVAPWASRTNRSGSLRHLALLTIVLVSLITPTLAIRASAQDETPVPETQTGQLADIPSRGPTPDEIGEPPQSFSSKRVYDMAGLLNEREQGKIESDARRLNRFGIPAIIITQSSDMTGEEAATFAADVRRQWGVETAAGADNGLVMLVIVGESARRSIFSVMSWGSQALPHEGVDLLLSKQIQTEWLDANLATFDVYEGVLFTLRRLIYLSIYEVSPPPPLSAGLETLQNTLAWLAPLVTLIALLAYVPLWFQSVRNRYPRRLDPTLAFIRTMAVPVLALDLAIASVWSRSDIGVLCTAIMLAVMVLAWIQPRHAGDTSPTVATTSARPRGVA